MLVTYGRPFLSVKVSTCQTVPGCTLMKHMQATAKLSETAIGGAFGSFKRACSRKMLKSSWDLIPCLGLLCSMECMWAMIPDPGEEKMRATYTHTWKSLGGPRMILMAPAPSK